MRTRDEKIIEEIYIKENVEKPLYMWLSERLGKNLAEDEWQRPYLLKLLKTLIKDEEKGLKGRKKLMPKMPLTRPVSTASVDISPESFPKNSTAITKEAKTLKQAYMNVYLKEEEDRSEYNSKFYDERYNDMSGKYEDFEFEIQGQPYMANIAYDIESVTDEGDYDTPPSEDIEIKELEAYQLFRYNEETGDFDEMFEKNDPQTWATIKSIAENQFLDDRSNWDRDY